VVTYHEEAVSNPEAVPVVGTVRDIHILAVNGQDIRVHLAHYTSENQEKFTMRTLQLAFVYTNSSKICDMKPFISVEVAFSAYYSLCYSSGNYRL
jgi:hypothetical protein